MTSLRWDVFWPFLLLYLDPFRALPLLCPVSQRATFPKGLPTASLLSPPMDEEPRFCWMAPLAVRVPLKVMNES